MPTAQFVIGASYMNDLAFLSTGMDEVYNLGPSGESQAMCVHVGVRRWSKHCSFSGSWTGASVESFEVLAFCNAITCLYEGKFVAVLLQSQ